MVYIILGEGFEEIEALSPCDILRRGGVEVQLAGIGRRKVKGSHGIKVKADIHLEDIDLDNAEMVIVPGGLRGVATIENTPAALEIVRRAYDMGLYVAAICAGPRVLSKIGVLDGKKAVCYPGMEDQMTGNMSQKSSTVVDGKVVTGRAAGASLDFAFTLLELLKDKETADKVRHGIHYGVK